MSIIYKSESLTADDGRRYAVQTPYLRTVVGDEEILTPLINPGEGSGINLPSRSQLIDTIEEERVEARAEERAEAKRFLSKAKAEK